MHNQSASQGKIRQQKQKGLWRRLLQFLNEGENLLRIFVAARVSQLGDPFGSHIELVTHHRRSAADLLVLQRRQELAIRLALGADHRDLLWLVIRHGLVLAVSGVAIGWIAGLGLTRLMAGVLYKTSAHDLRTFVIAPIAFLVIAWFASYLPARRATSVDPIETLKAG